MYDTTGISSYHFNFFLQKSQCEAGLIIDLLFDVLIART